MGLRQSLFEHIYLPTFEGAIKRRRTATLYQQALASQWQSREELEQNQLLSLNRLLAHAKLNCEFWKDRAGVPTKLDNLGELASLPILTKADIRCHLESMIPSQGSYDVWRKSTGGSTGEPLHFAYTKSSYEWRVAMSLRGYGWAGAPPGSKQAYIWGVATTPPTGLQRMKEKLHEKVERKRYFNCFEFDEKAMRECLSDLQSWRPHALVGYTNPLYELARFASQEGLQLPIDSILCAAEKVHPLQREAINRAFGGSVFDTYGSREFMLIASECDAHEGLHVSMENLIVEVVDDGGVPVKPGEVGRLLITDLHNHGMPFIRYEIGDLARATDRQCSCGRGLAMIEDIVGRSLDVIRTPEGQVVPGEFFPHLMKDYPEIQRFQVVQDRVDHLKVLLQGYGQTSPQTTSEIEHQIRRTISGSMHIELESVERIPLTKTGKHRVTISRLNQQDL